MPGGVAVYPMTVEQESIWLDDHMRGGSSRYVESWVCRLRGTLDPEAARWALEQVVARHEALRSQFVLAGDRLLQVVQPGGQRLELEVTACPAVRTDDALKELVRRPLDVTRSPLRATLVTVAPDVCFLVVQLHHLVIDDWALQIFEQEWAEHYRAHVAGRPAAVTPVPLQPGALAAAQRSASRNPAARAYWRDVLRGVPADTAQTLAADGRQAPGSAQSPPSDRGGWVTFAVDAPLAKRTRAICRQVRATPFAVFAATVAVLLYSASEAPGVIVGTPVSRRSTADHAQVIVPLSELLPLCLRVSPGMTFAGLVAQVRDRIHEALLYADVSYAELARTTRRRGQDLCRTVLVADDLRPSRIELPDVEAERTYVHSGVSKYDLCFTFVRRDDGYSGFLEYALDLLDDEAAGRAVRDFTMLLGQASDHPDQTLSQLADGVAPGVAR